MDEEDPKHPAAKQFIERLMRIAGTDSVPVFAGQTGQPERYVYRWRAGAATPNFINTIEMLERLGLLRWTTESGTTARPLTEGERTTIVENRDEIVELLRRLQELTGE